MKLRLALTIALLLVVLTACAAQNEAPEGTGPDGEAETPTATDPTMTPALFPLAASCSSCHDGIQAADGTMYGYVQDWEQGAHAHSATDPLFQAVARSETIDHAADGDAIQGVCASCHLPMADLMAQSLGLSQTFLDDAVQPSSDLHDLYADGDSCMICHQLSEADTPGNVSFLGSYLSINLDTPQAGQLRTLTTYRGISDDGKSLMQRFLGYDSVPDQAIRNGTVCEPCHTLYTNSYTVEGEPTGKQLPEQVTYLEWANISSSTYNSQPCFFCHMPMVTNSGLRSNREVTDAIRGSINQHTFLGSNSYLMRLKNDLDGTFDRGVEINEASLQKDTATIAANGKIELNDDGSEVMSLDVRVISKVGHKFPTGFPSRRAWLHVTVKDAAGNVVYESGAYDGAGMIVDNDGDLQKGQFEPHYNVIDQVGQVQIYESVMMDSNGNATTRLLQGVSYAKDNRLLPTGYNMEGAPEDCAVIGVPADDIDFRSGSDTVHYRIGLPAGLENVTVEVELLYQTVGYRFLESLKDYPGAEQDTLAALVGQNPNLPVVVTTREAMLTR